MQLLYEAVLCIWQLTFLREAAEAVATSSVVPSLVEVAKSAQKEKVPAPSAFPSFNLPLFHLFPLLGLTACLWLTHRVQA